MMLARHSAHDTHYFMAFFIFHFPRGDVHFAKKELNIYRIVDP